MLASITPLGERGRNRRWGHTVSFYVIGAVLGGATRGVILGGLGSLIPESARPSTATIAVLLGIVLLVAAGIEARLLPIPIPGLERQVNEDWLDHYRGWVIGFGFGYQLGLALAVYITSASLWVVFLAEFLTFSPVGGLAIGATFGVIRTLPLLATFRVTTPQQLRSAHARLERASRPMERVVVATLSAGAAVLIVGAGL
jgi:hypothetical protein